MERVEDLSAKVNKCSNRFCNRAQDHCLSWVDSFKDSGLVK